MSEQCNKNCYNCGNAYWGEKDEDAYCEITGREIDEINTANAECGCWTPTVVDDLKQQISDIQSQLAAKDRQLEAAAKDCLDGFECICCDHFQDCKGPSKDCVDYWRRRWEEAGK